MNTIEGSIIKKRS